MSFHIIDRENHRFVADLETNEEAKQLLAELLLANPGADLFIFSAPDDDSAEHVTGTAPDVIVPEPELRDQVERVRDTET